MASQPYTRTRSKGGFVNVPNNGAWYFDPACFEPSRFLYSLSCLDIGTLTTTTDVVTPGFEKLRRQGKLIVSPYTSTTETQQGSGLYSRVRFTAESCAATHAHNEFDTMGPVAYWILNGGLAGSKRLSPVSLITDAEIAKAISIAATQAWANASGHSAGILQDIAEMRQTLSMFTRPLSSIQPLLRSITRSKKGVLATAKDIGSASQSSARNLWLQYRYGIRPLVSSVKGILDSLNKPKGVHRSTYRGFYSLVRMSSAPGSGNAWEVTINYNDDRTDKVNVRAGLVLEESLSMATRLGVDAGGMLALPWELVPFSFVADWFINVGSFLEALVPAMSKDPLASWVTTERLQTRRWYITSTAAINPAISTVVRSAQETRFATWKTKKRVPGIPLPSITRKPQSLGKVFSDLRMVDAYALASQQLGRILSK
jgi:hypothetical protein